VSWAPVHAAQELLGTFAARTHHGHTLNSLPITTPGLFLQSYSLAHPSPTRAVTRALPPLRQDSSLLCVEFHAAMQAYSSILWMAALPSSILTVPLFGCHLQIKKTCTPLPPPDKFVESFV